MKDHLSLWGLTPAHVRDDIALPGSPERCIVRWAIEDADGAVWMLEQLRPGQFDRRERIGRTLAALNKSGLPLAAYRPGPDGRFVVEHDDFHWQLSPFISGDPLPQPDFVDHADRGYNLGRFLADLRSAGSSIREFDSQPRFDLEAYVNELMAAIHPREPETYTGLAPVLPVLAPLFDAWNDLPATLSHGDFHPLNIIWQGHAIGAVVDWEFAGIRPALFDAANTLGCVGIEDPYALVKGLAPAMLTVLRDEECLDAASLTLLPQMILGLRFAWMSEWLRKQDREMIEMEVRYMRLLANSLDSLLPAWEKGLGISPTD